MPPEDFAGGGQPVPLGGERAPGRLAPIAFCYLRHGQTDWNRRGLSQGSIDIPLNATGLAQADAAAIRLRRHGIAAIVSSPLSRARVTAEIIGAGLGLPITVDADLREVGFGVQEGQPQSGWYQDWLDGRFTPDGAESFGTLRERAVAAVNRATAGSAHTLIVAHGALFRSLRAAMGLPMDVRTQNAVPMLCVPPAPGQSVWTLNVAG